MRTFAPVDGAAPHGMLRVRETKDPSRPKGARAMSFFTSLAMSGSGLTAEQTRMDLISDNIANVNTLQTAEGGPYQREEAIFMPIAPNGDTGLPQPPTPPSPFGRATQPLASGVMVASIATDRSTGRLVYDPTNPLANKSGYVTYPNVNLVTEVSDMMGATRAYQANVTALNAAKTMAAKALEIGHGG
jgi:flagellar basal-body rod protein FlgC